MTDKDTAPTREEIEEAVKAHVVWDDPSYIVVEDTLDFLTSPGGRPHLAALASELLAEAHVEGAHGSQGHSQMEEALDVYVALHESLRETLSTYADRLDERVYSEFASALDDGALDRFGVEYQSALAAERARVARVETLIQDADNTHEHIHLALPGGGDLPAVVTTDEVRTALAGGTETEHPACCGSCNGTGNSGDPQTNGLCWDCRGTGHQHAIDGEDTDHA